MTSKEVRKLKRMELLEMLIEQSKEVEELRKELRETKEKLDDKNIRIEKAGTLAEASFMLNGVLEAAESAAKQYLDNIGYFYTKEKCEAMVREAEEYCAALKRETEEACAKMIKETEENRVRFPKKRRRRD